MHSCLKDVNALMEEIDELQSHIEQVSVETKSKIKPKPGVTGLYTGGDHGNNSASCGLYTGGDPDAVGEDNGNENLIKSTPDTMMVVPPQGAFSITSAEDDDSCSRSSSSNPNDPASSKWLDVPKPDEEQDVSTVAATKLDNPTPPPPASAPPAPPTLPPPVPPQEV